MARSSSPGLQGPSRRAPAMNTSSCRGVSSQDSYFGNVIYESPPHSPVESPVDSDSEDSELGSVEDDAQTDSTLDDAEDYSDFGHPLERIPRVRSADHGLQYDPSENVKALLSVAGQGSVYSSRSHSASSLASSSMSGACDPASYEQVVDHLIDQKPDPFESSGPRNMVMFDPPLHLHHESTPPLMVKRLKRSSPELILLLEINLPEPREDPWNAAPHILHAVERGEYVFLCMQRLSEYNQPPLVNVAHYIDFFRQVLEGLSFLHEERISGLSCAEPSSYMVDLNSAPHQRAAISSDKTFDRSIFPVRYYFANFSDATRLRKDLHELATSPSTPPGEALKRAACPFKRDVQDCGAMFNILLVDVPQIATKFKSLTKAMITGGFTADDSRRLFDALCHSLDAKMFESKSLAHQAPEPTSSEEAQEEAHTTPT